MIYDYDKKGIMKLYKLYKFLISSEHFTGTMDPIHEPLVHISKCVSQIYRSEMGENTFEIEIKVQSSIIILSSKISKLVFQ